MSVLADILATYRGPGPVVRRRMGGSAREDRVLVILMAGCAVLFVAQWPRLAREAHLTGENLQMMMGGSLMALLFVLPLVLYGLAGLTHLVAGLLGGQGTAYGARMALFWALLASGPVLLLNGLMAGFVGPGPQLTTTGLVALVVFLWFWIGGTIAVERRGT